MKTKTDRRLSRMGHVQNPPALKTHPIKIHQVKFENRLPIEGKG